MSKSKHGRNGFSKKRKKKYCEKNYTETKEREIKEKKREEIKIYTHQNVDLDNIFSIWIIINFLYPGIKHEIIFVPASYNGSDMGEDDIAVDIEARGKGIKGLIDNKGERHSSAYAFFKKAHLSNANHQAIFPLVNIIDKKDIYGKVSLAPKDGTIRSRDNYCFEMAKILSTTLRAFRSTYENDDKRICEVMIDLINGLFKQNLDFKAGKVEAEKKSFHCGFVYVVETSKKFSTAQSVFSDPQNQAYLYVDPQKNVMGVHLSDDLCYRKKFRLRIQDAEKIVEKFGEKLGKGSDEWFLNENGSLLSWGTRKDIRPKPSKIRPEELAFEINRLIEKYYLMKNKKK